eukprot:5806879-Amphidinium_carterae.1
MAFFQVLLFFFVGLFDYEAMKMDFDKHASRFEALHQCDGDIDSLVWDDRAVLLHLSFSPQWKNALEYTFRAVIIQEEVLRPLNTSYIVEAESCSIWIPPQRRIKSHTHSTWTCETDNSLWEMSVLWSDGSQGLSAELASLASSTVNTEFLNSMKPVHFGRRMRYKMRKPLLDPKTTHNCLFMCLSSELARLGVQASPTLLRDRTAKIWEGGWTYLGGS